MRIYYGIEEAAKELSCSVVSVGSFDGVHAGHRTLISRMNEYRDELNRGGCDASSVVVTFMPHPRQVLGSGVSLLNTVDEKALLMDECGLDAVVVLRFDEALRSMHSSEFFDMLCGRIGMKVLVAGYDHRFGCDGARGEQALTALGESYGVVTEVMPEYEVDGAHVSSTEVRKAMMQGDMKSVVALLTRPYLLLVTSSLKRINDGTIEFLIDEDKLLPLIGEYSIKIIDMNNSQPSAVAQARVEVGNRLIVSGDTVVQFATSGCLRIEFLG